MNDTYQDPNGELPEDDEMEMVDLITLCDEEGVEHEFDTRRVVGNRLMQFEILLAYGFMGQIAFREADAFYESFCEQLARRRFHVDHLILDRRRTAVQNQNYHLPYF